MREALEKLLNLVLKRKYSGIENIKVTEDTDYDFHTYKIYVMLKKYEDIYKDKEMVNDILGVSKTLGIKKRDIENVVWHIKDN